MDPLTDDVIFPVPTEVSDLTNKVDKDLSLMLQISVENPPPIEDPNLLYYKKIGELESTNKKQEQRVKDLELALSEARKIIKDREELLCQMQWRPKVHSILSLFF